MNTPHFTEQLAEKLQLMFATGDLRISGMFRQESITESKFELAMSFVLEVPNWHVTVRYDSDSEKIDLNKAIYLLAEKLAKRASEEARDQVDRFNKVEVPQ